MRLAPFITIPIHYVVQRAYPKKNAPAAWEDKELLSKWYASRLSARAILDFGDSV